MKKIDYNSKINVIKKDDIDTITFALVYTMNFERHELFEMDIIKNMVRVYSKKYNNLKSFNEELTKRLILGYSIRERKTGDTLFIRFELCVPREGLISDYSLEDAFAFFIDTIYNPCVIDGAFDELNFNREKNFIINRLKDSNRGVYNYSFEHFKNIFDPEEKLFTSLDNKIKYTENATPKSCYEIYRKKILENKFFTFVFGNIEENRVNELFNKYLPIEERRDTIEIKYDKFFDKIERVYHEEEAKFNQSVLYMNYVIKDYTLEEREYLSLAANILDCPDVDLLFKTLRTDNNLVYSVDVSQFVEDGFILIETYLANKNKELAIKLIEETVSRLSDRKLVLESLAKILKGIEITLLRRKDDKYYLLDKKMAEVLNDHTLEEKYNAYKNMDIDEFLKFIDRLKLNVTFFLRGDNNEEDR